MVISVGLLKVSIKSLNLLFEFATFYTSVFVQISTINILSHKISNFFTILLILQKQKPRLTSGFSELINAFINILVICLGIYDFLASVKSEIS